MPPRCWDKRHAPSRPAHMPGVNHKSNMKSQDSTFAPLRPPGESHQSWRTVLYEDYLDYSKMQNLKNNRKLLKESEECRGHRQFNDLKKNEFKENRYKHSSDAQENTNTRLNEMEKSLWIWKQNSAETNIGENWDETKLELKNSISQCKGSGEILQVERIT